VSRSFSPFSVPRIKLVPGPANTSGENKRGAFGACFGVNVAEKFTPRESRGDDEKNGGRLLARGKVQPIILFSAIKHGAHVASVAAARGMTRATTLKGGGGGKGHGIGARRRQAAYL